MERCKAYEFADDAGLPLHVAYGLQCYQSRLIYHPVRWQHTCPIDQQKLHLSVSGRLMVHWIAQRAWLVTHMSHTTFETWFSTHLHQQFLWGDRCFSSQFWNKPKPFGIYPRGQLPMGWDNNLFGWSYLIPSNRCTTAMSCLFSLRRGQRLHMKIMMVWSTQSWGSCQWSLSGSGVWGKIENRLGPIGRFFHFQFVSRGQMVSAEVIYLHLAYWICQWIHCNHKERLSGLYPLGQRMPISLSFPILVLGWSRRLCYPSFDEGIHMWSRLPKIFGVKVSQELVLTQCL